MTDAIEPPPDSRQWRASDGSTQRCDHGIRRIKCAMCRTPEPAVDPPLDSVNLLALPCAACQHDDHDDCDDGYPDLGYPPCRCEVCRAE